MAKSKSETKTVTVKVFFRNEFINEATIKLGTTNHLRGITYKGGPRDGEPAEAEVEGVKMDVYLYEEFGKLIVKRRKFDLSYFWPTGSAARVRGLESNAFTR